MYDIAVSASKTERALALLQGGGDLESWRDLIQDGSVEGVPSLVLEDFSGIPFLDGVQGVDWYQMRSRTRAGDGDLFVSTQTQIPGYEEYNQTRLGIGAPEFLHAHVPDADPLCVADTCLRDPAIMDRLQEKGEEQGRFLIHPYMGSPAVWKLARALQERTTADIRVLAPAPPASYAANHKGLMTSVFEILFGKESVCRTVSSTDTTVLAEGTRAEVF